MCEPPLTSYVTPEEGDEVGDIVDVAAAADRDLGDQLRLTLPRKRPAGDIGFDEARGDGVDRHTVRPQLSGQRAGESQLRGLSRRVGRSTEYSPAPDMPRERLSADMRQRIRAALAETHSLAERRNRIVHGWWLLEVSNGAEWSNVRPRRHQLLPRAERLTLEDMHRVASDIEIVSQRIHLLAVNVDPRFYGLQEPPGFDD
jgi:hypothetical protein